MSVKTSNEVGFLVHLLEANSKRRKRAVLEASWENTADVCSAAQSSATHLVLDGDPDGLCCTHIGAHHQEREGSYSSVLFQVCERGARADVAPETDSNTSSASRFIRVSSRARQRSLMSIETYTRKFC